MNCSIQFSVISCLRNKFIVRVDQVLYLYSKPKRDNNDDVYHQLSCLIVRITDTFCAVIMNGVNSAV